MCKPNHCMLPQNTRRRVNLDTKLQANPILVCKTLENVTVGTPTGVQIRTLSIGELPPGV